MAKEVFLLVAKMISKNLHLLEAEPNGNGL
jgi:hypothetical protein